MKNDSSSITSDDIVISDSDFINNGSATNDSTVIGDININTVGNVINDGKVVSDGNVNDTMDTNECDNWSRPYCEFHSRDFSKISVILISLLVIVLTSLLLYGIIWYERFGADLKRILTNKLVSLICWNGILGISTTFVTDTTIYLFAPLPKSFCLTAGFIKYSKLQNIILLICLSNKLRQLKCHICKSS